MCVKKTGGVWLFAMVNIWGASFWGEIFGQSPGASNPLMIHRKPRVLWIGAMACLCGWATERNCGFSFFANAFLLFLFSTRLQRHPNFTHYYRNQSMEIRQYAGKTSCMHACLLDSSIWANSSWQSQFHTCKRLLLLSASSHDKTVLAPNFDDSRLMVSAPSDRSSCMGFCSSRRSFIPVVHNSDNNADIIRLAPGVSRRWV